MSAILLTQYETLAAHNCEGTEQLHKIIIITICHIVAGTLFSWLPLTQGLYISHMTSQPECMVFQMAECLVIGTGVAVILKNKQEYIILRKWKAENI